jgi:3-deoxy-manno-octulosonate cytidylyltransferase (CMP-KDO synthetase)
VGLYAFRLETLRRFVALAPSPLEATEGLEQLRLLENDIPVHIALTAHRSLGVDRPEDLPRAVAMIRAEGPGR